MIRDGFVSWLKRINTEIPVFHAVIFPDASTIINKSPLVTNVHVASDLPILLKEYEKLPQVLSSDLFQEMISTLQSENTTFTPNPLCNKYSIVLSDLKKGLFCSVCHFQLLEKSSRMYYCPNCMNIPDNPFADAMSDWFFLVSANITNRS